MSVHLVAHKGFRNIMYENSLMAIVAVIWKKQFCEFDILFVNGQWKICHDFHALSLNHADLSELLGLLKEHEEKLQNKMIIDVKWDFVANQHDDLYDAIRQLKEDLACFQGNRSFWLQASHPKILDMFFEHDMEESWDLGMILTRVQNFDHYKDRVRYVMIALSDFTVEEIYAMSQETLVFGYTCQDPEELTRYRHLFGYLTGIVCDMSV